MSERDRNRARRTVAGEDGVRVAVRLALRAGGVVLGAVSGLHLYWAAGSREPSIAVIPEVDGKPIFRPSAAQTVGVAALTGAAGALYIGRANGWTPSWLFRAGSGTAATVLLARAIGDGKSIGLTKKVTGTRFARLDTVLFSPLCASLAASGLAGALSR